MMSSRGDHVGAARVIAAQQARAALAADAAPPAPRLAPVRRPAPPTRGGQARSSAERAATPNQAGAIVAAVALETGLTVEKIVARGRVQKFVRARAAAAWLARRTSDLSLPMIGVAIGGRDHSTVLYLIAKAEARRDSDPAFRLMTDKLHRKFSEARS